MTSRTNYTSPLGYRERERKKTLAANRTLLKLNFCYFNNVLLKKVVKGVITAPNY